MNCVNCGISVDTWKCGTGYVYTDPTDGMERAIHFTGYGKNECVTALAAKIVALEARLDAMRDDGR